MPASFNRAAQECLSASRTGDLRSRWSLSGLSMTGVLSPSTLVLFWMAARIPQRVVPVKVSILVSWLKAIPVGAFQCMVTVAFRQRFCVDQGRQDLLELLDVFPTTLEQTQIALELGGIVVLGAACPGTKLRNTSACGRNGVSSPADWWPRPRC